MARKKVGFQRFQKPLWVPSEHWRVLFLYYRCLTVTLPVFTAFLLSVSKKVCCQYSCFVLDHIWLSHNCTSNFWTWTSLLLFCSSNFAGRFQQDSATFIRAMSNVFPCFLSGTGPLKHLFLSVSPSLLIIHWTLFGVDAWTGSMFKWDRCVLQAFTLKLLTWI